MNLKVRGFLINLSLLIFSTLLALFLSELTLRLIGIEPLYVSPERDRFWKYDALLGWAHEPGQAGLFETPQFRTTVSVNERGLRDELHSYERQNDTERILVLGDSFAWGYGVEATERFSQFLEGALEVEVINAGVSGYSTDQEFLWYKNEGVKYETDLVILVVAGNDVGDNDRQLVNNIYYKPRFVLDEGQLVLTGYPVPQTGTQGRVIYSLSQRSALAYFLIQRYFDLRASYGKADGVADPVTSSNAELLQESKPFQTTTAIIHEIQSLAAAGDAKFMIVTTDRWWNYPAAETYSDFIAILQDQGYLVLDVESMPGFDPESMLIPDDGHWNQAGHAFVAAEIQKFIEQHKLLNLP